MTNNNTEIIESHMNWMMILNMLITTLEQRKRYFTDDMSQDIYIAMLDQFTEDLKLPQNNSDNIRYNAKQRVNRQATR